MHPGSPHQPPPQQPAQPNNQVGAALPVLVGGLVVLLIIGIIAAAMIISSGLENDDPVPVAASPTASQSSPAPSASSAAPQESPSPEPSTSEDPRHDSCLIGTWRETSHETDTTIDGVRVRLRSSGAVQHFRADGTLQVRYGDRGINARAKVNNRTYEVITTGRMDYNWQTGGGQILYSNARATGTVIWRQSGRETGRTQLSGSVDPERYTCDGNSLLQIGPTWTIELQRINSAPQ
ncbi:hypothetical protein GCM10022251_76690 [Phytohabitans flavus]|uniref:Uncharacterized protein n=1 Tax=Phytohabitans flavus TaxID=1076124 RepID=A0A6F8XY12_9ACTN|nr:hypothetical protein [Phytohabitans flavus]BCB78703.1 hypothetical protein Pflav_051130 [Phytohabitans flavus]